MSSGQVPLTTRATTTRTAAAAGEQATGGDIVLYAALRGLLLAELMLDGLAVSPTPAAIALVDGFEPPRSRLLSAAVDAVRRAKGPSMDQVLTELEYQVVDSAWFAVVSELADDGIVASPTGRLWRRTYLIRPGEQLDLLARLQFALIREEPIDERTALVVGMADCGCVLDVIEPYGSGRRHAREQVRDVLGSSPIAALVRAVDKEIMFRARWADLKAVAGGCRPWRATIAVYG